jgi:NADH dehydrogenase FAD-containing subunit
MAKHLIIVGGGHAHLTVLLRCREYLARGHRVTLVSPSPFHYYSGMGPGLLAGTYRPQEVRFNVRKMAEDRGAAFVEDAVVRVDASGRRLHVRSGAAIPYDIVSFNTGSDVALPHVAGDGGNVFPVKPIVSLIAARQAILDLLGRGLAEIVVIGGGPAGVEMTGNVWRLVQDRGGRARITLVTGSTVLTGYPDRLRHLAVASLGRREISVRNGAYVRVIEDAGVVLESGERLPADVVLVAAGVRPSLLFRASGLPTGPDGGLSVNRFLQCITQSEIFGGGDCISFEPRPLAKVGVYAVRQNPVLYRNLLAALDGEALTPFRPQRGFLLILNTGDGRAILTRRNLVWEGRLAWWLKDRIDRAFMRKFQVSDERDDQ